MAADDGLNQETELARRLREAHRRVRSCAVPNEERVRLARRLIAISDAAKHDISSASARLDAFLIALDDTPTS
ncbi:hypothetical protein J5X84_09585 [Streptosporangiaceae bacterium NEAU-GS5]|nr:hypothetical protein [Streptosporangiaceae bacterium NEAU-GS5]